MPKMIVPKTLKQLFDEYVVGQYPHWMVDRNDKHYNELRDSFYAGAFHMAANFDPNHLAELKQYAASKSIAEGIKIQ
jgi:hypothetical protein